MSRRPEVEKEQEKNRVVIFTIHSSRLDLRLKSCERREWALPFRPRPLRRIHHSSATS
jgi:hypothetical protein